MSPLLAAETISESLQTGFDLGFLQVGPFGETTAVVLTAIIHLALVGAFFGLPAGVFIWAERKVSARIQDRLGPTRVGGRFGWLQSLADGIKLIQKEDLAPGAADKMLFRVAPYIVVIASFAAYMFLPFSDGWVAMALDVGLFIALAVLALEVLGVVLAGYSSGSKWSLYGGMRETAQMVSYEIPLGLAAVIPVAIAGSMNLNEIVHLQSGCLSHWFIFRDPFTFLAFFVFFTATLAGNKRAPFDLAEAESELVAGFLTEYSGMRWSFFFLAEYASMYFVSALAVILFLGGWWTGLGGLDQQVAESIGGYPARVLGFLVLGIKSSLLVVLQIWIRWTLPRLRIDQVMTTCLKYLVPIACFLFLGSTIWSLVLPGRSAMGVSRGLGERMPVVERSARSGVVVVSPESLLSRPAAAHKGGHE